MIIRSDRAPGVLPVFAVVLVIAGCEGASTPPQPEPTATIEKTDGEQRCVNAADCASGQVCSAQSKGECVLQGDVCTGHCEDAAPATPPSSAPSCMKGSDCPSGQVCTVQSKGACVLQGDVCTGVCEPS